MHKERDHAVMGDHPIISRTVARSRACSADYDFGDSVHVPREAL